MLDPPDEEHVKNVCRIGQGTLCCRYLAGMPGGWICLKHSGEKRFLDQQVAQGKIKSSGDNCSGRGSGRAPKDYGPGRG